MPTHSSFDPGASTPLGLDLAVFLRLEAAAGIDALERMLLAYAVHADGLDFERAHLVLHDARSDELVAWSGTSGTRSGAPLEAALLAAAAGTPPVRAAERRMRWAPDALEGLAHLAWSGDRVGAVDPATGAQEGAVCLRRRGRRHGLLLGGWACTGDAQARTRRLERFAALAAMALTAWERREAARRAAARIEALAELARAGVSSLNLAEALHLGLRLAAQSAPAGGGALWTLAHPDRLRLDLTYGGAESRERLARALQPLAAAAAREERGRWIDRPRDEALVGPEAAGLDRIAVLPLVAAGRVLGALALHDDLPARPDAAEGFDTETRGFLAAAADLIAAALDQADRWAEARAREARELEMRARLERAERAAESADAARQALRDARHRAAAIVAFAHRGHESLAADDPRRDYLDVVRREAGRLEQRLAERLVVPPAGTPRLRLESVNELLQQALQRSGELLVRRRIRLTKKLAPDLPRLLIDPERLREAFANLLQHALETTAAGGRIRVESRRAGGHVLIELAHDGVRTAGDALEQLFVAFSGPAAFPATGLGLAQRIVREHGGEIRVRGEGDWSTVVALTLPVLENQDRRRSPADRRASGRDRRRRFPAEVSD